MNDYSPGALLRLSMSLKHINPANPGQARDLRQAAAILEGLSCLSNPSAVVGDAIEHAEMVRDITVQRRAEVVIERRIREGLRLAATKIAKRGVGDGHAVQVNQAIVCERLLGARQIHDSQARKIAYDRAETALHGLREALRAKAALGGAANTALAQAAREWLRADERDQGAFDRYLAAVAMPMTGAAPAKRAGLQPA